MPNSFVTVNPAAARSLAQRSSLTLVSRTTNKVALVARMIAPGSMKRHIRVSLSGTAGGLGLVICDHPATTFVIYKTKPHWIRPKKRGGRLRFNVNGEEVFARKVWHPGNQHPNNFLLKALEASKF